MDTQLRLQFANIQPISLLAVLQEQYEGALQEIFAAMGSGRQGSMIAMARSILARRDFYIYGGFVRDAMIRGDLHKDMDIDVAMLNGVTIQQGVASMKQLAENLHLQFVAQQSGDYRLITCTFKTVDKQEEFAVQVSPVATTDRKNYRLCLTPFCGYEAS